MKQIIISKLFVKLKLSNFEVKRKKKEQVRIKPKSIGLFVIMPNKVKRMISRI